MNAPVTLPIAPRQDWPRIAFMFRRGFDSATIAKFTGLTEAAVANALHHMREAGRA